MGQPQEVHIRKLQELYWSEADPDGRGFVPLADALRKAGDFREAHRLLREGLGRHTDFLSGHIVAAWLSLDRGKIEEAESRFRTVLNLDPRNISALRGLAEILLERGAVGDALGFLEALLVEDPLDLDLPNRVDALRTLEGLAPEAVPEPEPEPEPPVWDDPDGAAEELNWETAALQQDSSPDLPMEEPGTTHPPPQVVEDGEPMPASEELEDAVVTSTLGEIYLRQGLFGRAEGVFQTLLEGDPGNEQLKHRLAEVRSLLLAQGAEPGRKEGRERRSPLREEIVPVDWQAPDDESRASLDEVDSRTILPIEALAPVESVDVVPIESLAPDRGRHGPAATLAPDEAISIDALAPDEAISIDMLAPDDAISIDALAPDEVISIDALAPDEVISIDALAPDHPNGQPPRAETGGGGPEQDPTIDAFEKWLENLR